MISNQNLIGSIRTDITGSRIGDLIIIDNQPIIRIKTKNGGYDDISYSRLREKIETMMIKSKE